MVFRFVTMHTFDKQMDRQMAFLWLYRALHCMQSKLVNETEHSETKARTETRECETKIETETQTKNLL